MKNRDRQMQALWQHSYHRKQYENRQKVREAVYNGYLNHFDDSRITEQSGGYRNRLANGRIKEQSGGYRKWQADGRIKETRGGYRKRQADGRIEGQMSRSGIVDLRLLIAGIIMLILLTIMFGMLFSRKANAGNDTEVYYKYYKSIPVEHGDTLWKYAEEYRRADMSVRDYVREVEFINHIEDGKLVEGKTVTIPYYSTEYVGP